ncbi:uncharacterized protein LOC127796281 isoform X2 [Diospyros lotus]|uniref:uncharacterized protein LOC127796281 isoform X2 n=1 Tax=Diospyros lotus TaxID=55363 RepID=UPI00224E7230|nr:uncharacterized protein LOC127796281 isoform X2 [Diospyros lotus]
MIVLFLKMPRLLSSYLFAYNSLQALGWAICLFRITSNWASTKAINGAYASAGELICLLQTVAFLEVFHGAIGIVPSGMLLPLMQWGGRAHFLCAIVRRIPEVQEPPPVFMTFVTWCLIEVIRYPHYALNCLGSSPSILTYLRYTAFIVLYPLGVIGEMLIMYQALQYIKLENLYADFFTRLPFTYYNFVRESSNLTGLTKDHF